MASELFRLFPIPVGRIERLLDDARIDALVERFSARARLANSTSEHLSHSEPVLPAGDALLRQTSRALLPHVGDFGELLLGERLTWLIKEMWVNVLDTGGRQALHNHANSFVSGILYLTASHPASNTVFVKAPGGSDFVFSNSNARAKQNAYTSGKWVSPDPAPGDLLLFPSYLLHEVPVNPGGRRMSLAFNAIPDRLDAWGYTLRLSR